MLATIPNPESHWSPVALLVIIGLVFVVVTLAMSSLIGPSRDGAVKRTVYESGMVPFGDSRKRFNIRFYLVALVFILFDVEVVFLYPWATLYPHSVGTDPALALRLLVSVLVFSAILFLAYFWAWGKGVFRWD